jgi:hypothetical protein
LPPDGGICDNGANGKRNQFLGEIFPRRPMMSAPVSRETAHAANGLLRF